MNEQKKEVVDIFETIESKNIQPRTSSASSINNQEPLNVSPVEQNNAVTKGNTLFRNKKKFLFLGLVILLLAIIVGGMIFWLKNEKEKSDFAPQNTEDVISEIEDPAEEKLTNNLEFEKANEPEKVKRIKDDTDQDGLLDQEEIDFNTNILKIDSDDDGLSDYDEVKVYFTKPLQEDTDGDGYLDGDEVKNGYNPNGEGQLLNFEKAKAEMGN